MRTADILRTTAETDIRLCLNLDGTGESDVATGCAFLDHMLTLFSRHAGFDLTVCCKGDVQVDYHHSAEDVGIALGSAVKQALGDKRGIVRYGHILLPMDEALILCAADISGRAHLSFDAVFPTQRCGNFDMELVKEFWLAFVRESGITMHIKKLSGDNSHHIAEGIFKAAARTLKTAVKIDPAAADSIPSTKGVL